MEIPNSYDPVYQAEQLRSQEKIHSIKADVSYTLENGEVVEVK